MVRVLDTIKMLLESSKVLPPSPPPESLRLLLLLTLVASELAEDDAMLDRRDVIRRRTDLSFGLGMAWLFMDGGGVAYRPEASLSR